MLYENTNLIENLDDQRKCLFCSGRSENLKHNTWQVGNIEVKKLLKNRYKKRKIRFATSNKKKTPFNSPDKNMLYVFRSSCPKNIKIKLWRFINNKFIEVTVNCLGRYIITIKLT